MAKKIITIITCDSCGDNIDPNEGYIDAGVYGKEFHKNCLAHIDNGVIRALGIDDIIIRNEFDSAKYRG